MDNEDRKLSKADPGLGKTGLLPYLAENAHPKGVLAIGLLFFPNFNITQGCLLWEENYDPKVFGDLVSRAALSPTKIEQTMNRTLLFDLFPHAEDDVEDAVFEKIGVMLQRAWAMHLAKQFPDRRIIVDYQNDPSDYGPSITVFQQR